MPENCGVMYIRLEDVWALAACQCVPCVTPIGTGLVSSNRSLTQIMTLPIPGGAAVGDLTMVHISADENVPLLTVPAGWTHRGSRSKVAGFPYGGVGSHIYQKILTAGDLGTTTTWEAYGGSNICGGLCVFPGGKSSTIYATDAFLGDNEPLAHPSVTVDEGNSIWYVAATGTSFTSVTTFGSDMGTLQWNREATYQHSTATQKVNQNGFEPVRYSSASRTAARIAYTIVVS
jgi:hypothetical protein